MNPPPFAVAKAQGVVWHYFLAAAVGALFSLGGAYVRESGFAARGPRSDIAALVRVDSGFAVRLAFHEEEFTAIIPLLNALALNECNKDYVRASKTLPCDDLKLRVPRYP